MRSTKFILILIAFIFVTCSANAQSLPKHAAQIAGGYSKHGSGDMNGIVFGAEYSCYGSKKLSLNYHLRGGINDGQLSIFITDPAGNVDDRSVRYTTAGVQLGVNGRLNFVRTKHHEIFVGAGPFARYQSASNGSDGFNLYFQDQGGLPTALVEYDNRTPQQTIAVGAMVQLGYNFTTSKGLIFGLSPAIQFDTNGDTIPQVVLTIGKRFK